MARLMSVKAANAMRRMEKSGERGGSLSRRRQDTRAARLVHRKNGTSPAGGVASEADALVTYRELAPGAALRQLVRAYFTFSPGSAPWRGCRAVLREVSFTRGQSFCSPVFADGHASLVVELGATCDLTTGWAAGAPPSTHVMGPLRTVGDAPPSARREMVGVYLEPAATTALLQLPASELTDRVVSLDDVWGAKAATIADDLAGLDECGQVDRLEAILLSHLRPVRPWGVDVAGLTPLVRASPSRMTVDRLAAAAGVSRRHLTRVFQQLVGVGPKRYCRIARFQAGLVHAGAGAGVPWARVAAELGYADQSHMIAEFRELGGLTPESLATRSWFHPFILAARARLAPGAGRGLRS
jgi:AraC-like DNA-binding protein